MHFCKYTSYVWQPSAPPAAVAHTQLAALFLTTRALIELVKDIFKGHYLPLQQRQDWSWGGFPATRSQWLSPDPPRRKWISLYPACHGSSFLSQWLFLRWPQSLCCRLPSSVWWNPRRRAGPDIASLRSGWVCPRSFLLWQPGTPIPLGSKL